MSEELEPTYTEHVRALLQHVLGSQHWGLDRLGVPGLAYAIKTQVRGESIHQTRSIGTEQSNNRTIEQSSSVQQSHPRTVEPSNRRKVEHGCVRSHTYAARLDRALLQHVRGTQHRSAASED